MKTQTLLLISLLTGATALGLEHSSPSSAPAGVKAESETRGRVRAESDLPYLGKWSNGRGETLSLTARTIRFTSDRAHAYRDITRATNGQEYQLEITDRGHLNYFTRFLAISTGEGQRPSEMEMKFYDSYEDMMSGRNSQGNSTWERDE